MTKFILLFTLCSFQLQAQIENSSKPVDTETYFWFYVKLGKSPSKTTGMNRIYIKSISNIVNSGSFNQFIKSQQDGLIAGKIIIGPFHEGYQAKQSQYFYKYAGKKATVPGINSTKEDEDIYSFFFMKPYFTNSSQDIYLERIPSRVTIGTQGNFMDMLNEGLNFEKLAVGPFYTYSLSEKSKFVYGKIPEKEPDSLEHVKMLNMAKRWKSIKWKITKSTDNYEPTKLAYRFSTKFPRKYFAANAVQVVTIKASYSESYQGTTHSFTMQGDQVIDNNYIVSSEMSTVYIKTLYFDRSGKEKIKGFLFESFIYNDTELIDLDPIYIKIKQ